MICPDLYLLNVIYGETHEQVGDNNGHDEGEEDEQDGGVVGEGDVLRQNAVLSGIHGGVIMLGEHSLPLELSDHHHIRLDHRPGWGVKCKLKVQVAH